MGDEHPDGGGVDGTADRAKHVFGGGVQGPADAHLRDHHGGQHRPQPVQRNVPNLRQRKCEQGGRCHTQTEAQLGAVSG